MTLAGPGAVDVTWAAPNGGVTPSGYFVMRAPQSGAAVAACGSPTSPVATPSCHDDGLPPGTYGYTVTAVYRSWTATSTSVSVVIPADGTAPTVSVTSVNGQARTFPYPTKDSVTSFGGLCGTDPGDASAVTPLVNGSTTSPSSVPCTGGAWSLTLSTPVSAEGPVMLSARQSDASANVGTAAPRSVTIDKTPPTVSTPSVPAGYVTTTSVLVTVPAATDSGTGVATTTVQRATSGLVDNTCGAFGDFTTSTLVAGLDTVTTATCYLYRQQATDNAGNVATSASSSIVKVDTSAPAGPSLAFSPASATYAAGTTIYYRSAAPSGSFTVTAIASDPESAIAEYTFPNLGTEWAGTTTANARTYSWSAGTPATNSGPFSVTASNNAGLTSTSPTFTLTTDNTGPTVPTPTVPTQVSALSVPVTLGTITDSGSGVDTATITVLRASAPLTSGTCGTFSTPFTPVTLTSGNNDTTVTTNTCYQYQQRATDNVGNTTTSTTSSTIKVVPPIISSVTLANGNGTAGRIDRGDTIRVVFDSPMRASSMCSTWTSDTAVYSISGNGQVVLRIVNGTTTNDYLEVWTASGCTTTTGFGRLDLGSPGVVTSTITYSGNGNNASTITWDGSTETLEIRVGASGATVTPTSTTYVNSWITDPYGITVGNSPFAGVTGSF